MSRLLRRRYNYLPPSVEVDHVVIGAGVVGLAVAERLVKAFHGKSTFVVERNGQAGQETSSRNSEVIHAGLYYPVQSLKSRLCIRGRQLMYARCEASGIPHRKTQKLVIASAADEVAYLRGLEKKSADLAKLGVGPVPLQWLDGDKVRELEPDVSSSVVGALLSPETGIVDSHTLMESMENNIEENEGQVVCGTKVVRIDRVGRKDGKRGDGSEERWVVQTVTDDGSGGEGTRDAVEAKCVINAAGLNAHHVVNQILPEKEQKTLWYGKGSYFSYRGPGVSNVQRLLYPCPSSTTLGTLGTHLTMNLDNEIRFGPDVEWLPIPEVEGEQEMDFWMRSLQVSEGSLEESVKSVQKYLPGVVASGFAPDYVGIRPKLAPEGAPAEDFSITHPQPGFISLLGIESPGLTSSLAIAEYVEAMVRKEVWGLGLGRGKSVSEAGGNMDGWA
ncbi:hypothetical protein MNV49_002573 [Pseudohyphozyma bogoriensis]|nr:hypothetical protein MNV49_002573 [Pseudohyphozyma bogoriensis]